MNSKNCVYRLGPKTFYKFIMIKIPTVHCFYHKNNPDTLYILKTLETLCQKYYHVLCFSMNFESYRKYDNSCFKKDSFNIWVYHDGIRTYDIEQPTFDKLDSIFNTIDYRCSLETYEIWKYCKNFQEKHLRQIMLDNVAENLDKVILDYINSYNNKYLSKYSSFINNKCNVLKSCLKHDGKMLQPDQIKIKQISLVKYPRILEIIPPVAKAPSVSTVLSSSNIRYNDNPCYSYTQNITPPKTISCPLNNLFPNYFSSLHNQNKYNQCLSIKNRFNSFRNPHEMNLNSKNRLDKSILPSKNYFKPIILKRRESPLFQKEGNFKYQPYKNDFLKKKQNINDTSFSEFRNIGYKPREYAFKYFEKRKCAINNKESNSVICESAINPSIDTKMPFMSRPIVIKFSQSKPEIICSETEKINNDKHTIQDTHSERKEISTKPNDVGIQEHVKNKNLN